jgi:hypothetical protein
MHKSVKRSESWCTNNARVEYKEGTQEQITKSTLTNSKEMKAAKTSTIAEYLPKLARYLLLLPLKQPCYLK